MMPEPRSALSRYVWRMKSEGRLVVQPRMGFADVETMRSGLRAVKDLGVAAVGTITVDSYTRLNRIDLADEALRLGEPLNGFPLVSHGGERVREVVAGILSPEFPVQVRHGSAEPFAIVEAMLGAGLSATEGGPISYCLPYGRTPFSVALREWRRSCELLANSETEAHLESFGGCLMGQLCPPSLLVAISVLEGLFFIDHGIESISLSYAQQANLDQDVEAVHALRRLIGECFTGKDVHIVLYTYMGMYPETIHGAVSLLKESAHLAQETGIERLIVKTAAEAYGIPTIKQNLDALLLASTQVGAPSTQADRRGSDSDIYVEARLIVEAVRSLSSDIGTALQIALRTGYLDVPFCLHPDNLGMSRSRMTTDGRLVWSDVGRIPIENREPRDAPLTSSHELHEMLTYRRRSADAGLAMS